MSYDCPNCQSSQTQKVSAVYENGTGRTSSSGVGVAFIGDGFGLGVGGSSGVSQTHLASKLSPPAKLLSSNPFDRSTDDASFFCFVGIGIFSMMIMGSLTLLGMCGADGILGSMIFLALSCGGMYFCCTKLNKRQKTIQAHNKQVDILIDEWQKQWYCHRCGNVFVPGNN